PAEARPQAGMDEIVLTASTTLSAATVVSPSPAMTTLMNSWNAANSKNQLKPFGRPKRTTRRSSDQRSLLRARGAPPQPNENATTRNAKPSQLAIVLATAAPRTPSAGAPRWPSISSQLQNTAANIVMKPAIICIQVLPRPPYQLPSASTPTIAVTDNRRISM